MIATKLVEQIRAHMEAHDLTQIELSKRCELPQSTISRALKSPVRITKTHRAICKFIGITIDESKSVRPGQDVLVQTVLQIWDGTREHAQSIARLLNATATLEAHAANRTSRRHHS